MDKLIIGIQPQHCFRLKPIADTASNPLSHLDSRADHHVGELHGGAI